MMGGWKGASQKDMMLGGAPEDDEESSGEWEEEFNKFYTSPLDQEDELKYL